MRQVEDIVDQFQVEKLTARVDAIRPGFQDEVCRVPDRDSLRRPSADGARRADHRQDEGRLRLAPEGRAYVRWPLKSLDV